LFSNLNSMLKSRRLEPLRPHYGGSDPDFGPKRAEKRRDAFAAMLDLPAPPADVMVTDSGAWRRSREDTSIWELMD
jgi:hypothetical protein